MPRGDRDQGPRRRLTPDRLGAVAGVLLLAAGCGDDSGPGLMPAPSATATPTVTWGALEGEPGCTWHPRQQVVEAALRVTGTGLRPGPVTLTVTAHADENTSRPVGSAHRTVELDGTVDTVVRLTIEVSRPPYVDIDGVVACSLDVAP